MIDSRSSLKKRSRPRHSNITQSIHVKEGSESGADAERSEAIRGKVFNGRPVYTNKKKEPSCRSARFPQSLTTIIYSDCKHQKTQSFQAMIWFHMKFHIKSPFPYPKPIKKSDLTNLNTQSS